MTVLNYVDGIYLGSTAVDRAYLGDTLVWSAFDSFATLETEGPRAFYEPGGGASVQEWLPPFKQGLGFKANRDIYVYGARWWRLRPEVLEDPGIAPILHIGFELGETQADAPLVPTWTEVTGWQPPVYFPAPMLMARGQILCVWFSNIVGDASWLARTAGFFATPTVSRQGLMTTQVPSAWFQLGDEFGFDADVTPGNRANAWYWVDPLVAAVSYVDFDEVSFSDNFERADGGLGANWLDHVGGTVGGAPSVAATIASGAAVSPTGAPAVARRNVVVGDGQIAEAVVQFPANGGNFRLITRMTDAATPSGASFSLERLSTTSMYQSVGLLDDGMDVNMSAGSITIDATAPVTLRIESDGLSHSYYRDDVLVHTVPQPGEYDDIAGTTLGNYLGFICRADAGGAASPRVLSITGQTLF